MEAVPEDEWFCPKCSEKPGRPIGVDAEEAPEPAAKKRRGKQESTDEEIEDDVPVKKAKGKGEKVSAAAKCECTVDHSSSSRMLMQLFRSVEAQEIVPGP